MRKEQKQGKDWRVYKGGSGGRDKIALYLRDYRREIIFFGTCYSCKTIIMMSRNSLYNNKKRNSCYRCLQCSTEIYLQKFSLKKVGLCWVCERYTIFPSHYGANGSSTTRVNAKCGNKRCRSPIIVLQSSLKLKFKKWKPGEIIMSPAIRVRKRKTGTSSIS